MLDRRPNVEVVGTGFTVLDRIYEDGLLRAESLGGSCGNVLVSLAMLRRAVAPVLSLGRDEVGERLLGEFRHAGADVTYISLRAGLRSPMVTQDLDTASGRHDFSFVCRETNTALPRYQPIGEDEVATATLAIAACAVFYADRLSADILGAMRTAHDAGAIVYFEPSDVRDDDLFDEALRLTTILKYSADRLGPDLNERVDASGAVAIVTHGAEGLEVRRGCSRVWSAAVPASTVTDTCGAGDMVSIGIIDWLLGSAKASRPDIGIDHLMHGVRAGQRLAAANCAFAGARGLFLERGATHVRDILGWHGTVT